MNCCKQCPYARSTPKTYLDTKGQNGTRFAGQALANFELPCHMGPDFENWPKNFAEGKETKPLCAGAEKFRANLRGGEKDETVFASLEELLAHHYGISESEAALRLQKQGGPRMLMAQELSRKGNRLSKKK